MLVTILGPDGTGKTTLARALAEKTDGLEYMYFGYNKDSRDYQFFDSFVKLETKNILKELSEKDYDLLMTYMCLGMLRKIILYLTDARLIVM